MISSPPLHDPQFHAGDPFPAYRALRAQAPVHWHPTPGFWALTRHEDVLAVSRDPATFCSSRGVLLSDIERPVMPRQSIIYIDPPEHAKYRKLVQPAFSPGRIRALEERIGETVRRLLDRIEAGRSIDFVDALAAPLPLVVIADMLGVPGADRERFKRWSDAIIDAGTQQTAENMAQSVELLEYFGAVIADRRQRPADDLISVLVHSRIDGEQLEEFDLLMFCMTLLVAGNETTRNLLSQGALALATHADERAHLVDTPALMAGAVEEMLRWGSPISSFMRVATRDTDLRGEHIRAGDRLLMLYASANRDEAVFGADAEAFGVTRDASRHVAFGFGEHFCLGAQLARMEARIAFGQLLARFRGWELAGKVERLPSVFIRGIVHLPLAFSL
ncbi:MAG TPA: cytochrome P450 [Mycobacterium sp.]|nr:cytochrome P450 [Mycobacterium sp.]